MRIWIFVAAILATTNTVASAESATDWSLQHYGARFEVHPKVDNGGSIVEFGTKVKGSTAVPLESFLYLKFYGFVGEEPSWLRFGEKSGFGLKVGSTLSFDITPQLKALGSFEAWVAPTPALFAGKPATKLNAAVLYVPLPDLFFSLDYAATFGDQNNPLSRQQDHLIKIKGSLKF